MKAQEKKKTNKAAVVIIFAVILALVVVAGVIFRYTNGLTEDFKTFYVEVNGEQVFAGESTAALDWTKTHRVNVRYTFDVGAYEPRAYNVKVTAHVPEGETVAYKVDGATYLYESGADITAAFGIEKESDSFTLTLPSQASLKSVLQELHKGSVISVDESIEARTPELYTLVVSSYDGGVVYRIHFAFDAEIEEIVLPDGVVDGGQHARDEKAQ